MATRRLSGLTTSSSVPDNGGDHSGGGGSGGGYVENVFSTYVYEGNGQERDIVNGIDLDGEGGLIWTKSRSGSNDHALMDTARGVAGIGGFLESNTPDAAETGFGSAYGPTAYNNNGYTLGPSGSPFNGNGVSYCSWTFRKAPKFFDVVTYTGNGVAGREIPHNLGVEPGMIIVKNLDQTYSWNVYSRGMGATQYLRLNTTQAFTEDPEAWNDTEPTSTEFTLGDDVACNASGDDFVAYVFAHDNSDESMIKCGSYTGTGTVDQEIDLGWEPQWVLFKKTTQQATWTMVDSMRGFVNGSPESRLCPNTSAPELSAYTYGHPTPTGFKLTTEDGDTNTNGQNYIYMAIRRPNKPAGEFEPEELFALSNGRADDPSFVSGFPVDMGIWTKPASANFNRSISSRLVAGNTMYTDDTVSELKGEDGWDYMDGYITNQYMDNDWTSWMWRRAPGYFDVVAYEGDGVAGREVPHNLGVAPEMMWIKNRSASTNWPVYYGNSGKYMHLSLSDPETNSGSFWNSTSPTQDLFTVGSSNQVNGSGDNHIAYLFASVPGISKVGSYTGNGSEVEVDCGFTTGARWVLIKAASHTGDWLMTVPISALNFMVALNTTDPMVGYYGLTATPNGFKAKLSTLNNNGTKYIFYAIA